MSHTLSNVLHADCDRLLVHQGPSFSLNSAFRQTITIKVRTFFKEHAYSGCPCSLQDLCKPDSGRLRRNLSAIVNFTKFREEKLGPWTELQDEVDALLDEEQLLEQTKRALVCCMSLHNLHCKHLWPEKDESLQSRHAANLA